MRARLFFAAFVIGAGALAALAACVSDSGNNVFTSPDGSDGDGDVSNIDGASVVDGGSNVDTDTGTGVDSGGAKDAGIDATPVPAQLDQAGVVALWLVADPANYVMDQGRIAEWKDLSKNGNNAACSAGTCPAANPNAIAGHGSVQFAGGNAPFDIKDSTTLQFGTEPVAVFAVAKTPGVFAIYTKDTCGVSPPGDCFFGTGLQLGVQSNQLDGGDGGYVSDLGVQMADDMNGADFLYGASVFDDHLFHIVGMRRYNGGSNMTLYVDERDASDQQTSPNDISQVGQGVILGPVPGSKGTAIPLDVAEVVILHQPGGVVSQQMVDDVRSYLSHKYGL